MLAVDGDERVVGELYSALRAEGSKTILPLVVDLADASPARGWRGLERRRLEERGRPDLVLCLALVHHLAIGRNVPFAELVAWLRGLGARLVIEFADRDDPMVSRLLAAKREEVHEGYGREAFERALGEGFEVERREQLGSGTRTLYLADPETVTRPQALPWWLAGLHLLVLWSFAVAQPLFDLLGKNGEFFAARGSTRWDAIVFALVLLLVPPAILLGLESSFGRSLRWAVHAVFVAGARGAVRAPGDPRLGRSRLAAGGRRGRARRRRGRALPARACGAARADRARAGAAALSRPLPLQLGRLAAVALDGDGAGGRRAAARARRADRVRRAAGQLAARRARPHRRRSASRTSPGSPAARPGSSTRPRSARARRTRSRRSSPAASRRPASSRSTPTTGRTCSRSSAAPPQLHVVDQETHLCPPSLCPGLEGSLGHRTATLAEDTGVVYLHELLPDDLTGGIPSIANGWDNFLQDASKHNDPGRIDPAFLALAAPAGRARRSGTST